MKKKLTEENRFLLILVLLTITIVLISGRNKKKKLETPIEKTVVNETQLTQIPQNESSNDSLTENEVADEDLKKTISILDDDYKVALNISFNQGDNNIIEYQAEALATKLFTDIEYYLNLLDPNLIDDYPEINYDNIYKQSLNLIKTNYYDSSSYSKNMDLKDNETYYTSFMIFNSKDNNPDDLYIEIRRSSELSDKFKNDNFDAYDLFEINIM